MPIQRTLSPVPPLGKKTHHMVLSKKDFNSFEEDRSPLRSLSSPNGLTSAIVTPSSLSADGDHSMNGLMYNLSSLVFAEDTDDESVTEQGKATDHKVLYDSGKMEPEPLLVANPRRFVLFPIQDNEVCINLDLIAFMITIRRNSPSRCSTDLGNVQEGRSIVLDCRRN
jgi:hypothetical protein